MRDGVAASMVRTCSMVSDLLGTLRLLSTEQEIRDYKCSGSGLPSTTASIGGPTASVNGRATGPPLLNRLAKSFIRFFLFHFQVGDARRGISVFIPDKFHHERNPVDGNCLQQDFAHYGIY